MPHKQPLINIKQRIVGAIIIVSLIIIVLPMVFFSSVTPTPDNSSMDIPPLPMQVKKTLSLSIKEIPAPPPMPDLPRPSALPVDEFNAAAMQQTPVELLEPIPSASRAAPDAPAHTAETHPYQNVYVIQLASFSEQQNALRLSRSLTDKGFKADIEMIRLDNKKRYRVRVGPYILREQAVSDREKIYKSSQLKGRLLTIKQG